LQSQTATGLSSCETRKLQLDRLTQLIAKVCELLPAQGPISAFVFLNTLQALEDLPFDEGVRRGARLFGCQPYMTEDFYRKKLDQGRIKSADVDAVLSEDLGARGGDEIVGLATRQQIKTAMLRHPLRHGPAEELRWYVAETDALTRLGPTIEPEVREKFVRETRHWVMRDLRNGHGQRKSSSRKDARPMAADLLRRYDEDSIEHWSDETWESFSLQLLWRICREGVHGVEPMARNEAPPMRHRDLVLDATEIDTDIAVHDVLIRYCAAFTDQGFASWQMPHRDDGFWRAFVAVYGKSGGAPDHRLQGLAAEVDRAERSGMTPIELVHESLELLGVAEHEWDDYVAASILALRGWAGLLWQMEVRPDRVPRGVPAGTIIEFLAVRLLLERVSLSNAAREKLGFVGPLDELRSVALEHIAGRPTTSIEERAFLIFQTAEFLGWSPESLFHLSKQEWGTLVDEIESFSEIERRRILHQAFERRYRVQALDAISIHTNRIATRVSKPQFQAVFCIDAREESFRRHLEEVCPDVETFAAPGFFCVPIYFRGVADAHFATLCPIVVRPQHWVVEEVVYSLEEENRRRAATRKALGTASHRMHIGSRGAAPGALLTAGVGVLASIPLVARVLFPRLTAAVRRRAAKFVQAPQVTRLRMERTAEKPSKEDEGFGFTLEEMTNFAERVLRDIGLTTNLARIVFFCGHGSQCLNNPHKSAYDCGACSGAAGGPNARALAAMCNDPRVRTNLAERGVQIPKDTYFIGGQHNTATDEIAMFDLDLLPHSHLKDLESARQILAQACERNAHERCRRFQSAPLNLSTAAAHRHVQARAEDLAQTRPEFGNASNAVTFVGRRERLRGLFMDRRAFMHSYDPTTDDAEATILGRILGPVVVVCSGINLQYYFSHVDSPGWGCGTKLPHNVTSLLGVMDGHASDLRCGLPWQGVEIHEPVRSLFVFETTPEMIFKIMERNHLVDRVLRNGWGQLALLDPHSSNILCFRNGDFVPYVPETTELPQARTSIDWYRGWRDHLPFAQIGMLPPSITF
jgi:uncharacterized protein YbcC (UPF0753/DUF2309 family)